MALLWVACLLLRSMYEGCTWVIFTLSLSKGFLSLVEVELFRCLDLNTLNHLYFVLAYSKLSELLCRSAIGLVNLLDEGLVRHIMLVSFDWIPLFISITNWWLLVIGITLSEIGLRWRFICLIVRRWNPVLYWGDFRCHNNLCERLTFIGLQCPFGNGWLLILFILIR